MRTVLLLDDDRHFRTVIAEALAARGCRTVEARTGQEASQALREERIDLVVVDGLLPDTDGVTWIADLRARGVRAPVVFVTAFWKDLATFERLTAELGVSLVLYKPVVPAAISEQIDGLLESPAPTLPAHATDFQAAMAALRARYAADLPVKARRLAGAARRARRNLEPAALDEARTIAHRLRGTAGTHGLTEVATHAATIEERLLALPTTPVAERPARWAELDSTIDTLVAAALAAAEAAAATRTTATLRPPTTTSAGRVLLVESDPLVLERHEQIARRQLYNVATATSPAAALDAARTVAPDAVLIDVALQPAGAAFTLARDIRALPACKTAGLAFLSSGGALADRIAATAAGASVFLQKPVESETLGATLRQLCAPRNAERPRVLLLDDDPDFAGRVGSVLTAQGLRVTVVGEPTHILDSLEEGRPDALLLDLDLPHLSGLEVCRLLRTSPRWQDLPIVVVTADPSDDARLRAFGAGADDFLVKPFSDGELVARLTIRVERSRLRRERLERDILTGLLLRRSLIDGAQARLAEARRHGRPLSLCIIDLDHFKDTNDRHGHLAGDRVLTGLGSLLASRFRAEDLRGRWGGEEFILVFPGERSETIASVVGRVLDEFRAEVFVGDRGESFRATFSGGVAVFPDDGDELETLLAAADRRLYQAKKRGRNQIVAP